MNRKLLLIIVIIGFITLTGCASTNTPKSSSVDIEKEMEVQTKLELISILRYQKRLDNISHPIMRGGHTFCDGKVTSGIGLRIANKESFPDGLQKAAEAEFGLDNHTKVLWLVEDTPAQNSGILAGDTIISVNGYKISGGKEGLEDYKEALKSAFHKSEPLSISIQRNGQEFSYAIKTDKICEYPVTAILDATPNAFADGNMIGVNSGLLRLFMSVMWP